MSTNFAFFTQRQSPISAWHTKFTSKSQRGILLSRLIAILFSNFSCHSSRARSSLRFASFGCERWKIERKTKHAQQLSRIATYARSYTQLELGATEMLLIVAVLTLSVDYKHNDARVQEIFNRILIRNTNNNETKSERNEGKIKTRTTRVVTSYFYSTAVDVSEK